MTTFHDLTLALVRTTLATGVAACLAALLLAWLKIDSPRTHRAAWLLVVLQGWLLFPWTLKLERPAPAPVQEIIREPLVMSDDSLPDTTIRWTQSPSPAIPPRTWKDLATSFAPGGIALWLVGATFIALFGAWRYARIIRALPLGAAVDDPQWAAQWRRELAASRPNESQRIDLRITAHLGPLLAFVPWRYLILAPRELWSALGSDERAAILRHELAHVRRRDLWKSLAIRTFALPQWFNPFVWLAVRRFDEAAEWACDSLAAGKSAGDGLTLANSLLRTAELACPNAPAPRSAAFITAVPSPHDPRRTSKLSPRIHRLINPRFKEESIMKKFALLGLLAAIAAAQLIRIEHVTAEEPFRVGRVFRHIGGDGIQGDRTQMETGARPGQIMDIRELKASERRLAASSVFHVEGPTTITTEASAPVADDSERKKILDEAAAAREAGDHDRETAALFKLPYIIEPPDILSITIKADPGKTIALGADLAYTVEMESLTLQCLVAMDGRINFGKLGSIYVAGMTMDEARKAIEKQLGHQVDDAKVSVDVLATNSKVYYIITKNPRLGDDVVRAPITGNETVIDAIASLDGVRMSPQTKMWVARPAPNGVGEESILNVDWNEISSGKSVATNYHLRAGDRLFIDVPQADPPRTAPPGTVATKSNSAGILLAWTDADGRQRHLETVDELPENATVSTFLAQALQSDVFRAPNLPKVDLAAAAIYLKREGRGRNKDLSWTIGWDATTNRPPAYGDRALQAGDQIFIEIGGREPEVEGAGFISLVFRPNVWEETRKSQPWSPGQTVGSILAAATFPNPIDFSKARITLIKPDPDAALPPRGIVLPIVWDREANRPTPETDYPLPRYAVPGGSQISIDLTQPPHTADSDLNNPPSGYYRPASPAPAGGPEPVPLAVAAPQPPAPPATRPTVFVNLSWTDNDGHGRAIRSEVVLEGVTTLGSVLKNVKLPKPPGEPDVPIDISAGTIVLSRVDRTRAPGKIIGFDRVFRWDAAKQQLTSDDEALQAGDEIRIDLRKADDPSRVAAGPVLPNPVLPAAATTSAAPLLPPTAASPIPAAPEAVVAPRDPKSQVIFKMAVIEDHGGNLAEFEELKEGMVMVSDSKTILGTIRMLEKHDLTKRISDPKLVTEFGRRGSLFVGQQVPVLEGETIRYDDNGFQANVVAHDAPADNEGRVMEVELSWTKKIGKKQHDVSCKVMVHDGQTIVLNAQHPKPDSEVDGPWPVYLVVTPERISPTAELPPTPSAAPALAPSSAAPTPSAAGR